MAIDRPLQNSAFEPEVWRGKRKPPGGSTSVRAERSSSAAISYGRERSRPISVYHNIKNRSG